MSNDNYKPVYRPTPARDVGLALGRTLADYGRLMRLHRPIGILLLLWPALWGLWFAGDGQPAERTFVVFMLGVLLTRSAGCVINDYADRNFDPHVKRTRERPLATGRVAPAEALILFFALGLASFALAMTLNPLTRLYAVAGGVLAATYPFLKRHIHLPQFYLGVAFAWSIPMAFAELTDTVPRLGWLLLLAVMLWAVVYDTLYAMVDREDDLKLGLKSTAILFGEADRIIIGVIQAMTLFALYLAGREVGMGGWYLGGLLAGALLFGHQQWLVRHRDPAACFAAFNHNHYFGMVVFLGIALDYQFR